jgi:hypothetical protein
MVGYRPLASLTASDVAADLARAGLRFNAGWWRMATEYGLFDERCEFLVSLGLEDPNAEQFVTIWARVGLLDEWDLAGGGASLLRSTFGKPIHRPLRTGVRHDLS